METITLKWLKRGFKLMQYSLIIISIFAIVNSFLILFQALDFGLLFIIGYILLFLSIILILIDSQYIESFSFIISIPLILIFLFLPFILNFVLINVNINLIKNINILIFFFFIILYISFFFLYKSFLRNKDLKILGYVTLFCLISSSIIFSISLYTLDLFLSIENINKAYVARLMQGYLYLYYSFTLPFVYLINFIYEGIVKLEKELALKWTIV